jgi:hypothetical protein
MWNILKLQFNLWTGYYDFYFWEWKDYHYLGFNLMLHRNNINLSRLFKWTLNLGFLQIRKWRL